MTIYEFAKQVAKHTEQTVARRYGITEVEVTGTGTDPRIHIVNRDFDMDIEVPVRTQYQDFEENKESQLTTYGDALVFEIEYVLFNSLKENKDISKYLDFDQAGEKLYTKLIDKNRESAPEGTLGRQVDEYGIMILYIQDGYTKTYVNKELVNAWGRRPEALFIKASENSETYQE